MVERGESRMMTMGEVAAYFRVSSDVVRRWVDDGRIEAVVLPGGRTVRFREDAVQAFVEDGQIEALRPARGALERRDVQVGSTARTRRPGRS